MANAVRFIADDTSSSGASLYLGIAAIVSAATGLIAAVTALVRVLRTPVRREHVHYEVDVDDADEGEVEVDGHTP